MESTRGAAGPSDIAIRQMMPRDHDAVIQVWEAAGLPYRPMGRDSAERMRIEMERGTAVFLVAVAEERIVGVVLGTHDGRRGWINRLAVLPSYRRRGIAAGLVGEVERRMQALGIDIVAALIERENEASLDFFRNIDYVHDPAIEYVSKRRSPDT